MSRGHEGCFATILAAGGLLLAGWCLHAAQRPNIRDFQGAQGVQVVLETIPMQDGKMWVRPKFPIYINLLPKDTAQHLAPKPPHSLLICREYLYQEKKTGDAPDQPPVAAFLCGSDTYIIEGFGFSQRELEGDPERHRNLGVPALY